MTKTQTTQALADLRALDLDLRTLKAAQAGLKKARKAHAQMMLGAVQLDEQSAFYRARIEAAAARLLETCAALSQGGLEAIPEAARAIAARS